MWDHKWLLHDMLVLNPDVRPLLMLAARDNRLEIPDDDRRRKQSRQHSVWKYVSECMTSIPGKCLSRHGRPSRSPWWRRELICRCWVAAIHVSIHACMALPILQE